MLSEGHTRHHTFPLLSHTYRSHQLWTPLLLKRLTINQKNYHQYLKKRPQSVYYSGTEKRLYGDNGFFMHKGIPIEQKYDKTMISRSDVRPWDQVVPRPMTTNRIFEKESGLPFPSQHPYTSHISQFAVFPDTKSNVSHFFKADSQDKENEEESIEPVVKASSTKANALTQTDCSYFDQSSSSNQPYIPVSLIRSMAPVNVVKKKAFSDGARIEILADSSFADNKQQFPSLFPGIYRWDVSRARPSRKSAMTYPAPSTMYSPMDHPMMLSKSIITPRTFQALQLVNNRVATSTAYKDYYSQPAATSYHQMIRRPSLSNSSLLDSRGKYASIPKFTSVSKNRKLVLDKLAAIKVKVPLLEQSNATINLSNGDDDTKEANNLNKAIKFHDQSTQTDDEHDEMWNIELENQKQNEGLVESTREDVCSSLSRGHESYLQPSSAGSSCGDDEDNEEEDEYQYPNFNLDQPYSKSEALKYLHMKYPERVPDLRRYSISKGK